MRQPFSDKQQGFFNFSDKAAKKTAALKVGGLSLDLLHRNGCNVCPLNKQDDTKHPQMKPSGSETPIIYMLGPAPSSQDDKRNQHFSGSIGHILRDRIPEKWLKHIRFNNCVRTRPPGKSAPGRVELECCRPSVADDIAATKPEAIFGFGPTPLNWLLQQHKISLWHGRRIPVTVGGHKCWFFPIMDPEFVLGTRRFTPREPTDYGSDMEFAFAFDLKRAFDIMEGELVEPVIHDADQVLSNIDLLTSVDDIENRIAQLYDEKVVGFDYETDRLRPYDKDARILSVALAGKERTFSFGIDHPQCRWSDQERRRIDRALEDFLYKAPCAKAAHHLAFEAEWTAVNFGRDSLRVNPWHDTESQAYLLDQRRGVLSLNLLSLIHFGIDLKGVTGDINTRKLASMPLPKVLQYNGVDAKYHRALYFKQKPLLKDQGLEELYPHQIERVITLVLTQTVGVPIDLKTTKELQDKYEGQLAKIETKLDADPDIQKFKRFKKTPYRPGAPQDVLYFCRKVLHEKLESSDEAALSEIKHPAIRATLRWRGINKALSTYVKPMLPESEVMFNHKLHPIISTTTVRTWRTSSEDPNIQNWPKHEKIAQEIRRQFHARRGYKIVAFDYAGIQARNVAMESLDKKLIDAFWSGYDIHSDWRDRTFKIYPDWYPGGYKAYKADEDAAKAYRQKAKNGFVFATFFGAWPKTTAQRLGVPVHVTEKLRKDFFREFPEIEKWHQRLERDYYENGYVTGLSGFKRWAPVSPNQLINSPIQADESIIVLDAMIRLSQMSEDLQACLEVHDDLTFHWPENRIDELAEKTITTMLDVPFEWARVVPIGVEASIGDTWGDLKKIGEFSSDTWKGGLWKK